MLKDNYLSVLQFQLKFDIICHKDKDTLVVNKEYEDQITRSIEVIKKLKPDICVFPEMTYQTKFDDIFKELSKGGNLIVFGSTYVESVNKTQVYYNGELTSITKRYPCGSEPMVRFTKKVSVDEFIKKYLNEHEFLVKGKKVYVLNCLEYYQVAYVIARDYQLSKNLFGFIVPCSNSNPKVFMDESRAIHNHNENIYSFVCNRIKKDGTVGYGRSYVFGPIQYHEKDWLKEEGINSDDHNASILNLDSSTISYAYGKYAKAELISRFGRSDNYINTPKDVQVKKLI